MAKKQLIAIIDVGSLSLRLKVFEAASKEYPKEIESVRRFLSLGAETYRNGVISSEQIAELCEILAGYVLKMKEYKIKDAICVATSAFREAKAFSTGTPKLTKTAKESSKQDFHIQKERAPSKMRAACWMPLMIPAGLNFSSNLYCDDRIRVR